MPTNTDLVTDLPADFAVFGQAVDTSMADLKGGTTGQILSKATNTDMDFTWIANDQGDITNIGVTSPINGGGSSGSVTIGIDDATTSVKGAVQLSSSTSSTSTILAATPSAVKSAYDLATTANTAAGTAQTTADAAIAKTTVTTAGDIIYRNATVPTRLGIGTAGQVLSVNSGATAPQWTTVSSGSFTKIVGNTFSASAGVTEDACFTTTYKAYKLIISAYNSTRGEWIKFRWRRSGVTETGANFTGGRLLQDGSGNIFQSVNGIDGANILIMENVSSQYSSCELTITQVGTGANQSPLIQGTIVTGYWLAAGTQGFSFINPKQYDGFNIVPTAGTMTGYYTLYGLAY